MCSNMFVGVPAPEPAVERLTDYVVGELEALMATPTERVLASQFAWGDPPTATTGYNRGTGQCAVEASFPS